MPWQGLPSSKKQKNISLLEMFDLENGNSFNTTTNELFFFLDGQSENIAGFGCINKTHVF